MGSFLPLVEAFLALALTMLALTAGVSAMTGSVQRLLRLRAAGLQQMMIYLYRNEIGPLLERLKVRYGADTQLDEPIVGLWTKPAAGLTQFLVDMTALPIADLRAQAGGQDPRLAYFEPGVGAFRRWRNLRRSLDNVTAEEFDARFKTSALGLALARRLPAPELDAGLQALHKRFLAYGEAATEGFRRGARVLSFACAAVLAGLANIDSLQLLNAYLAYPALRASLIAEYEKSSASEPDTAAAQPTDRERRLGDARRQLRRLMEDRRVPLSAEQRAALGEVDQAAGEVEQTVTELRTTVLSVAQSFPVGWNLYPNCAPQSPDTRCAALLARATPAQREAFRAIASCETVARTKPTADGCDASVLSYVSWVASIDSSGLLRWVVGIVLTVLLAGLGTPFWIQVVTGFLAARNYLRAGSGPPLSGGADAAAR